MAQKMTNNDKKMVEEENVKKEVKDDFFSENDDKFRLDLYNNDTDKNDLTFAGAVYNDSVWKIISKGWNTKTCSTYLKHLLIYVFPKLDKPMIACIKEDYDSVMADYDREQMNKPEGKRRASSFRRHLEYLIGKVVEAAADVGICEDVLWGTRYSLSDTEKIEERLEKYLIRIPKSFTPAEEIAIEKVLLEDNAQSGYNMGLAIMFCIGCRENEACAITFGDIKKMEAHQEEYVAWLSKTSAGNTRKTKFGGKTVNAPRIVPIPARLYKLITKRVDYLKSKGYSKTAINKLPIACHGEEYERRCTPSEISRAGRQLLKDCKVNEDALSLIDIMLDNDESENPADLYEIEKDPTTYMFRRNLATHLSILGLDQNEIQYIMGHDIEDPMDSRNYYRNPDKLYKIAVKMKGRPLVNEVNDDNQIQVVGNHFCEENQTCCVLRLPTGKRDEWHIQLTQREPGSSLKVEFPEIAEKKGSGEEFNELDGHYYCYQAQSDYKGPVNIITKYHEVYEKAIKDDKVNGNASEEA